MKNIAIKSIWVSAILCCFSGCAAFLDELPHDSPADVNFFGSEQELIMAVNACYRELTPHNAIRTDAISDIGYSRNSARPDINALANGVQTTMTGGIIDQFWTNFYRGIARCNVLLANMEKAAGVTDPDRYKRIDAEARFLRAYYYALLTEFYGDVPLVLHPSSLAESKVAKTPKAEIVAFILDELQQIAPHLPVTYPASDVGRATQGAALAIRARTALYNGNWAEAAASAKAVMDRNVYRLESNYGRLFTYEGVGSEEVIFEKQFLEGNVTTNYLQDIGPRIVSGISIFGPTQALVDSYECIDGLTIDKSPRYDVNKPFDNRDPRLDFTIVHDGTVVGDYVFSTNPADMTTLNTVTGEQVANPDVTNVNASFTGYCWNKYFDRSDLAHIAQSHLNFIIARYAEVLLIFAEAKIELNQIDDEVLHAINSIRARAYGVDVEDVENYPAVTTTAEDELRTVLRRERKVELACEGFRMFDIKRWEIAEKVMNSYVYGRPKSDFGLMGIPAFDAAGIPDYAAYAEVMRRYDLRSFDPQRDYVWPIPQKEIDVNENLVQNPNY